MLIVIKQSKVTDNNSEFKEIVLRKVTTLFSLVLRRIRLFDIKLFLALLPLRTLALK